MDSVSRADLNQLCKRLDACREKLVARSLNEQEAWAILREAEQLLDRARGGRYEATASFIYDMMAQVWTNAHTIERLKKAL